MLRVPKQRLYGPLLVFACAAVASAAAPVSARDPHSTTTMSERERAYRMWTDEYGELWCGGPCGGICCAIVPVTESP
jgi:hypothetical protein